MAEFDRVFISHRSWDYSKALRFERFLKEEGISDKVVLLKNETLCKNYEQLTVHEYFEAIEKIKKEMEKCNYFFYIDCPNYTNGYFTSAELLQWRRIKGNCTIYPVIEEDGAFKYGKVQLGGLSREQKKRLTYTALAMEFDPEYGCALESWGKYAHDCFLVGCTACGGYYLVTKKRMNEYIGTQKEEAICPYCNVSHATFYQCTSGKKYFNNRYPIIMHPNSNKIADLRQLEVEDVIDLLDAKKLPERFALLSTSNDNLQSDFKKRMKSLGGVAAGIAGGLALLGGIFSLFDKEE